jgi:hypothetical protein
MKYLVDSNVLSEPTKSQPAAQVVEWLKRHEADLALSAIVLGELQYGILLLPAGKKRTGLLKWFAEGVRRFPILDFDASSANEWAKLLASLRRAGKTMPLKDSLIAASAKRRQLSVATRNAEDFRRVGVKVVNPFVSRR